MPTDALKKITSISDQFKNSFNAQAQQVAGNIKGFLSSKPTSVGEALDNVNAVSASLGKLGFAASSSVSQAFNQLSAILPNSKFADNFTPPSKADLISPEEKTRQAYKKIEGLTYPENIGEYFIIFNFLKYERNVPLAEPKDISTVTINLPIPNNLQEQFGMQYSDKSLGVAGLGLDILNKIGEGKGQREQVAKAFEQGKSIKMGEAAYYGARTVMGLSDTVGSAADKATGAVLNPYQAMMFQGVNLRSHSFSYRFSPNSQREHDTLKRIVHEFRSRMHPEKTKLLYLFPDVVDIKFGMADGDPYFFKKCFLESMTVNHNPQGTPSFFADSRSPVEMELTLNFKEIEAITREDFKFKEPYYGDF